MATTERRPPHGQRRTSSANTRRKTLYTMKTDPGFKRFGLYARSGGSVVMLPIDLPDRTPSGAAGGGLAAEVDAVSHDGKSVPGPAGSARAAADAPAPRLRLLVTITNAEVRVWSVSGAEGTMNAPKLKVPLSPTAMSEVTRVLTEIVSRWWPSDSPTRERQIVLQADTDVPIEVIAAAMAAMRATPDHRPLFPDILFSAGFE